MILATFSSNVDDYVLHDNNDNNLEKRHDERRQPIVVGRRGQRATRRSRRLRRMRRRAGGSAAGRETAEAVRKSDSKSVYFRSEAEMTDVLPGV